MLSVERGTFPRLEEEAILGLASANVHGNVAFSPEYCVLYATM